MMAKPWDQHRRTITTLYIKEGRTLEDVRTIMKNQYRFEASIRSYRQHFDLWSVGKYNCKKRRLRRRSSSPQAFLTSPPVSSPETESRSGSDTGSPGSTSLAEPTPIPVYALPPGDHRGRDQFYNNGMYHGHSVSHNMISPHLTTYPTPTNYPHEHWDSSRPPAYSHTYLPPGHLPRFVGHPMGQRRHDTYPPLPHIKGAHPNSMHEHSVETIATAWLTLHQEHPGLRISTVISAGSIKRHTKERTRNTLWITLYVYDYEEGG